MKIAVVGCGFAGPASAIFLKQQGYDVTVFEQAPQLGPVGAGLLLQPLGLEVLERLGCRAEVERLGARVEILEGWRPSGRRILHLPYRVLHPDAYGLGIHRGRLFSILYQRLAALGIPVLTNHLVQGVRNQGDEAFLDLAEGASAGPYDLVVVADGARGRLWGMTEGQAERLAHVWGAWWMSLPDPGETFPRTLHQIFDGSRRLLGILPTGLSADETGPSVSIFWGIRLNEAEAWRENGLRRCRLEMLRLEPRLASILEHLQSEQQMTLARYYDAVPRRWWRGRAVVVGDAAHAMSPHLGQGANLAFLDAAALGDALASGRKIPEALSFYQSRRERHVRTYHGFSRLMTPFFQSDRKEWAMVRDRIMPLACGFPPLQRRMVRVVRGEVRSWFDLLRG
jgi:2-polyprenyl-6-methoxyphenol hydroxylase-like FAD-dependent oxidoreductase